MWFQDTYNLLNTSNCNNLWILFIFSEIGDAFQCYSSVGREHEKKWNENGASYECRTEANAIKRRCVKFRLCKYWKYDLNAQFGFVTDYFYW